MKKEEKKKKVEVVDKLLVDNSDKADLEFKPTLFDIHEVFDVKIVGDYISRMALFTNWILAQRPVIMTGPRSSGKTYLMDHVSHLIGDKCFTLNKGSDKSGWYQAQQFMDTTHVKVIEFNKLPKDMVETLKDWGEGKESSYSVTVENPFNKRKYTQKHTLPLRPYVICLADENDAEVPIELRSRITEIRTDSSIEQNKLVLAHQANLAMYPDFEKEINPEKIAQLKTHINTLPPLGKYQYVHPAADIFLDSIPHLFTDCRREFPKYLYNIYGIARFYWKERIIIQKNNKCYFLITPQDMYLNHLIFGKALIDSSMKCNSVEKQIVTILKSDSSEHTAVMVQKKLREKGLNVNSKTVKKHLETLADIGYVTKSGSPGLSMLYTSSEFFHEFTFDIDWKAVVERCKEIVINHYPECFDEYNERFLQSPAVIHPFTGELVNIIVEKIKEKGAIKEVNIII